MADDKHNMAGKAPDKAFVREGMGSAHAVSLDKKSSYKYEDTGKKYDAKGPPWGAEQSMKSACEEAGVDYDNFIQQIQSGASDAEAASELGVQEATLSNLKDRFFKMDAVNGNVGQD